jgi:PIN domain nuclease of toxin-antitoxin system
LTGIYYLKPSFLILDACALIAYFGKEDGAETVKNILRDAIADGDTKVFINKINLLEVYYDVIKAYDEQEADKMVETVKKMPIKIIAELSDDVFKKAGQLKAKYKISIADSIAIAETIINKGSLITSDHHEIEPVEMTEKINVTWFR